MISVNLGGGFSCESGWHTVDLCRDYLIHGLPAWLLRIVYRFSGTRRHHSRDTYIRVLRECKPIYRDLRKVLPYKTGSVDRIVSSHCLEHFSRDDAIKILSEIRRVLCPSGRVTITVPSLEYCLTLSRPEMLGIMYPAGRDTRSLHRWMWDAPSLVSAMTDVGLRVVNVIEEKDLTIEAIWTK